MISSLHSLLRVRRSEQGFTLIEALVSVAVLGIIMTALTSLLSRITTAMRKSQARNSMIENLNMASEQMATDMRNIGRNNDVIKYPNDYELIGVDADNKYENSTRTPHNDLSSQPNNHSDRIHFHAVYSNDELDNRLDDKQTEAASERVYVAYWVNGEGSPKTISEMKGRWGIVKRRQIHTLEDMDPSTANGQHYLPYYESEAVLSPLEDLNQSGTRHSGVGPLAFNIDYLSFRYYDHKNSAWQDSWDSKSKGYLPSLIQFSMRAYDNNANFGSNNDTVKPIWYKTAVSIRRGYE